jgi:hypothetical protein
VFIEPLPGNALTCHNIIIGTHLASVQACHPSGRIKIVICTGWCHQYTFNTKPAAENPAISVVHVSYSQVTNSDIIDTARENLVTTVGMSLHSIHKVQPSHEEFVGPFKTYYDQKLQQLIRNNPECVVTDLGGLFGRAYMKAARAEVAAKSFHTAGLFHCIGTTQISRFSCSSGQTRRGWLQLPHNAGKKPQPWALLVYFLLEQQELSGWLP